MPSTFRSSRSGRHLDGAPNRTRTGQIDHDVFEGLPVRRWSKQPYTFSQAPKTTDSEFGVQGPGEGPTLPELPMPRDSQLLPPISRALLRAARAGCINILQGSRAGEDEEKSVADAEDSATASHTADRSFTTRKWQTLPKHLEPAEVEFLAKRRPGLPSLYGASAGTDGSFGTASGPMRRTKFKKTDPETGNISIYQAWVPEGHRIEGEITGDLQTIVEQSDVPVKPEAPAPGTVVEGVGIVNAEGVVVAEAGSAAVMTPPKRRPPPPKRKGRGIGKGRKKKVMFAPGEGADAAMVHGVAPAASNGEVKGEGQEGASQDQTGQDEDDEDGDEGDESDDGDESMLDAKTPDTPRPLSETPVERPSDVDMADTVPDRPDALELSSLPEKEPSPQKQPMVPEPSQVDVSTVKEEAQPNETPLPQEKPTTTSELAEPTAVTGEAQESNPELQGRDPAGVPSSNIEPKEEPEQTSGEIKTTPPTASPRQPSENPTAQPALQSHIPEQEQPLGEVTNPDENTVPTGPSDQAQKSPDLPNEPPLNSNTQDKPSLASESASASAQENPPPHRN
ncbi:hypothetical protein N7461_004027 [Penicillium sp. DV-2018c]|nr:hypothetical protein N7461_004027 [Penicillium sp. DV-2018c]